MSRNDLLSVKLIDGHLVISIGIDTLVHALDIGLENAYGYNDVQIVSSDDFAKAVVDELRYEEDDGSTVVHRMLDNAARRAIDNGCEGIEIIETQHE